MEGLDLGIDLSEKIHVPTEYSFTFLKPLALDQMSL
jgi:hypothetical protein